MGLWGEVGAEIVKFPLRACISLLEVKEKLILITPMHDNTPEYFIFLIFLFSFPFFLNLFFWGAWGSGVRPL